MAVGRSGPLDSSSNGSDPSCEAWMDEDVDGVKLAKCCEAHLLHQYPNEDSSQKYSGEKEGERGGTMLLGQK